MALNYTTLQSTVLAQAIHTELSAQCPQFVRMCEAMIKREVRAFEVRGTVGESQRSSLGLYNLSGQVQEVRAVYATGPAGNTYALENVGAEGIRMLPDSADVQHYCVSGQTIEFRGVPGTGASMPIVYFGWPDALEVTATNQLLTDFEDMYVYGTLFHVHNYVQELELAQAALSVFGDCVAKLNKLNGRRSGGASILPAYNFGHINTGSRY